MEATTATTTPYIAPELTENVNMTGIAPSESEEIKLSYSPYFLRIAEIKEQAKKINFENPSELDQEIARKLRIATVKIRTGCEDVKNERKRLHSLKANIEQAAYNLIAAGCKLEEEVFLRVEKAQEIKAKAEKEALKVKRLEALQPYNFDPGQVKVEDLSEAAFEILLSGLKQKAEEAEKAAAKAEAERIETEAKAKRKAARVEELMNLGAKKTADGVTIEYVNTKEDSRNDIAKSVTISESEIEYLSEENYPNYLNLFKTISAENEAYNKFIGEENARLLKEKEEQEQKQKRYNARVRSLTELGADTTEVGFVIKDLTKDEKIFITFGEVMDSENESFSHIEGWFKQAKGNNDYQLEQSRKEAAKIEDQKKRAAEAKEKRYNERLAKLINIGGRIEGDAVVIRQIGSDNVKLIPIDNIREVDDETFDYDFAVALVIAKENEKQLNLEKEAREKAEKELADQKAAKEKSEKEAEEKRIAELEAKRKAALAPDKEKLLAFAEALKSLPRPALKANEAANIMTAIEELIGKTVKYLTEKANQL